MSLSNTFGLMAESSFKLNKTIRIEVRLPPPNAEAVSNPYAARAPRKWERIEKFVVQAKR